MAQIDSGIGGLPAGAIDNEDAFAGGGIVAFAGPEGSGPVEGEGRKETPQAKFIREMMPAATQAAKELETTPQAVLSMWALETGWGNPKAIQGKNNYGNIQYQTGPNPERGILGSRSGTDAGNKRSFVEYDSPESFASDFTRNIRNPALYPNFKSGQKTADEFLSQIPQYAEDKNYRNKVMGVHNSSFGGAAPPKTGIASRILSTVTGTSDANAAEVPGTKAAAPTTDSNGVTVGDVGGAAGVAALGGSAIVERINNARNAAIAARNAALSVGPLPGGTPPMPKAPITAASVLGNMGSGISAGLQSKLAPVLPATKLGAAAALAAPIASAVNTYNTSTDDYYKRFGLEQPEGNGLLKNLKDLGVRGLGAASDLGNTLTFGLAEKYAGYRDKYNPDGSPILKNVAAAKPADKVATPSAPAVPAQRNNYEATQDRNDLDASQQIAELKPQVGPAVSTTPVRKSLMDIANDTLYKGLTTEPLSREAYDKQVDAIAKKEGTDPASMKAFFDKQSTSFTNQAVEAKKNRDVDLWMSAAQGFFAMGAGTSPRALQNFAMGAGIGVKQAQSALNEYGKAQKEINAAQRDIAKFEMSHRETRTAQQIASYDKALARNDLFEAKKLGIAEKVWERIIRQDEIKLQKGQLRESQIQRLELERGRLLELAERNWLTHQEKNALDIMKAQDMTKPKDAAAAQARLDKDYKRIFSHVPPSLAGAGRQEITRSSEEQALLAKYGG
jgi:hypothetical protein